MLNKIRGLWLFRLLRRHLWDEKALQMGQNTPFPYEIRDYILCQMNCYGSHRRVNDMTVSDIVEVEMKGTW